MLFHRIDMSTTQDSTEPLVSQVRLDIRRTARARMGCRESSPSAGADQTLLLTDTECIEELGP